MQPTKDNDEPQNPQPQRGWQQHQPGYQPVRPLFGGSAQTPEQHQANDSHAELKHRESLQKYPNIHLSKDEYVITEVRRHPIGVISIWVVVAIVVVATFALLPLYSMNRQSIAHTLLIDQSALPAPAIIGIPLLIVCALFALGGLIATYVYNSNRFYLTNESVIQHIQTSLFSHKEQVINLASIEDASYRQDGILETMLGYGSLRLSTEGEETTYRFQFVASPRHVVHEVNEAIENATGNAARFRNGNSAPISLEKQ